MSSCDRCHYVICSKGAMRENLLSVHRTGWFPCVLYGPVKLATSKGRAPGLANSMFCPFHLERVCSPSPPCLLCSHPRWCVSLAVIRINSPNPRHYLPGPSIAAGAPGCAPAGRALPGPADQRRYRLFIGLAVGADQARLE